MKLPFLSKSLFATLLACFFALSLNAQTEAAPTDKAKITPTERRQKAEDHRAKELSLTEEQKVKFKQIDEESLTKAKATRATNKAELAKIREDKIKAHKGVLNTEQAAKYDEMVAKKKAKHETKKAKKVEKKAAKQEKKAEKKAIKEELKKQ